MSWILKKIFYVGRTTQRYTQTTKCSYHAIRLLSSKEIGFAKTTNNDILMQNLKSAPSANSLLDLISAHHKIMNNKHIIQALRSLFYLQKNRNSKSILSNPAFKALCLSLKSHIRSLELNDLIESLKILSFVGVPTNGMIIQIVLQMIRHNVNNLSLQQIIFLDFLLKQFQSTPLSEALLIALPIVFEVQLPMKLDRENIFMLSDALQYAAKYQMSDDIIQIILDAINLNKNMNTRTAMSIIWSLCDLKPNEYFAPLLTRALKIVVSNGKDLKMTDLETTLTKLTYRYNTKSLQYYNKEFFDLVAQNVIDNDMGYQQTIWILQKFAKVSHSHNGLLDYLSTLCHENSNLVPNLSAWNLFNIVSGCANTVYRPVYWESIKQGIFENKNVYDANKEFNWIKFATRLAMLDIFIPEVLEKAFHQDYVDKILQEGNYVNCEHLLVLYQALKAANMSAPVLDKTVIQRIAHIVHSEVQQLRRPLRASLERALGGENYLLTDVLTPHSHLLHHVVVMRKGGYPIAFNTENQDGPVELEQLNLPVDSHVIAIFGCDALYYKQDSYVLRNLYSLMFQTIGAMGHSVINVSIDTWLNLPDHEKIPYLMQAIRNKNEEFEKLSIVQ